VVVVGCVLVSGLVWPMSVVVLCVIGEHPGGVVSVVDQDVVGAFGVDGADEPLARNSSRGEFVAVS
jgi:hypothetical protein